MGIALSERRSNGWGGLWLVTTSLALSSASTTLAQEAPPPPKYEAVDANGVDLLSGSIAIPERPVNSIGEGAGGLTATERVRYGQPLSSQLSYVKLDRDADSNLSTTVVLLGATETFVGTPAGGAMPDSYTSGDVRVDGADILYTQKNGTVARFTKVTLGLTGPATRIGYLKSVTYPTGDKITADIVYGGNMQLETSVGYAMTGSIYGSRWSPIAANLKDGSCSAGACSGPSYADQAALGRALTTTIGSGTVILTDPAGGATRSYTINSDSRVTSFSNGSATWTYAYSEAVDALSPFDAVLTVTVTDPLGNKRIVRTRLSTQHILSDTVGIKPDGTGGQTTTFQYEYDTVRSGFGLLKQITGPEGNRSRYDYDGHYNVTAKWDDPKPSSGLASTSVTASYNTALCASIKVCDKPDWVRDARGNQTDFTYDPVHGGVLTVTKPAGTNGVRPQTRYTYGQFTARYISGGAWVNGPPVWRLIRTSTCASGAPPACLGTADETVTEYAYEPSSVANNVRLLSTTTRAGDNSLSATTSYAYDARGDVISTDGPLPGSADTTRAFYDASRWKVGEIGPDPDGAGPLAYRARKTTYANDGQVTLVETGKTTSQADLSSFTAFQSVVTDYDAQRRAAKTSLVAGGATQTVTQYGYDAAGRQICSTVRMNREKFGELPASACALGEAGVNGPDRIAYTEYDAAGRVTKITSGYGLTP